MEVVLLQRIENLGQMGDVVSVKPGFARNYLLPQKKALRATKENLARFEQQRAQLEAANLERRSEAEKISGKIDGLTVVVVRQAGETGQLYGSVSPRDIAESVTAAGFTVTRSQILMDRPIKMLGLHPVRIALHPEVIVTVTVNVAKSEEEAEVQLEAGGFVSPAEAERRELEAEAAAAAAAEAAEAAKSEGEATS
ncbi:MAG: 50S ribosomal protein L9 [Alphaproteobacteria bacterium]|nr:MAG: 50S ribosomal protein L9 [Alphaproteobacteria bacterium]